MKKSILTIDKYRAFWILSFWFILTQAFPPINLYIPVPPVLRFPLFVGGTMILFPLLFKKRSLIALFLYIAVTILFFLSGNSFYGQIGKITNPFLDMSAGLLIAEYTIKYDKDYSYTRFVIFTVIIANVVMALISIPEIYAYPNILRFAFKEDALGNIGSVVNWLISYHTCHGLPFLFAPLIFLCRRTFKVSKKQFVFWGFSTLVFLYIVYLSNASTALLVSIMMVALGLFFDREKFSKEVVAALCILGIFSVILSSPSVSLPILDFAQSHMDETWSNYHKIDEIRRNITMGSSEGDLGEREEMYTTSLMLFFESPILGTSQPQRLSHHSFFIDRLACLGIMFVIPLVLIFVYNVKAMYRNLHHSKVVYVFGVIAWLLLITVKNEFGQGTWLYGFAFLPLLCRYIDYTIDNNNKKIIIKE